jgi:hypothetical protein
MYTVPNGFFSMPTQPLRFIKYRTIIYLEFLLTTSVGYNFKTRTIITNIPK